MLAMDTSGPYCSAGLVEDDRVLVERIVRAERSHSQRLLPMLEGIFEDARLSRGDLKGIAVTRGPGSYTGVRIALTLAKSMAWALRIPAWGIDTLEAVAWQAGPHPEPILALVDARRGRAYTALYRRRGNRLETLLEPELVEVARWGRKLAAALEQAGARSLLLTGPGSGEHTATLEGLVGGTIEGVGRLQEVILPRTLADLAGRRAAAGDAGRPADLNPLYLGRTPVTPPRREGA